MAVQVFKLQGSGGLWVAYDEVTKTAKVYDKPSVKSDLDNITEEIRNLNSLTPTNQQLLTWARANYPYVDITVQLANLTAQQTLLQGILDLMVT
jgi:hypothetical protein